MTGALAVVLDGNVIGHLNRTPTKALRFAYGDTATGHTPLSLSMALGTGPFTGPVVERFSVRCFRSRTPR